MHQGNNKDTVKSCFNVIYLRKQWFRGEEERHGRRRKGVMVVQPVSKVDCGIP